MSFRSAMSWLVFGSGEAAKRTPPKSDVVSGADADEIPKIVLAKGRGYTFPIVGESHRQSELDDIAGGKGSKGHRKEVWAQLVFIENNEHDPNAVGVMIDAKPVGWVSRQEAPAIRREIAAINPDRLPVVCSGMIVGGFVADDGFEGSYGVKLSLSRPLKIRKP